MTPPYVFELVLIPAALPIPGATALLLIIATTTILIHHLISTRRISKLEQQLGCSKPRNESDRFRYDIIGIAKAFELTYHFRRRSSLSYTNSLFRRYGDTYASNILGHRLIFTCSPQNITHLLSTAFKDFDSSPLRKQLFEPITPHGVFTVDGIAWRKSREQLRGRLANLQKSIDLEECERHFQAFLQLVPSDGGVFDVQAATSALSFDLQTAFSLGESVGSLRGFGESKEKKAFFDDLRFIKDRIVNVGFRGPLRQLIPRGGFLRACKRVRGFAFAQISRQVQENNDLDGSRKAKLDLDKQQDEIALRTDQALSILLANDSMSTTLSVIFYCVSKDERVARRLRESILEAIGNTPPSWAQLGSLRYVRLVIFEALRLYPPVVLNGRFANKHSTLPKGGGSDGGSPILIQKGDVVIFSTWARHRLGEDFGAAPEEFRPERWEHLPKDIPGFIPFNKGPRICPGQQYAMVVLMYIVARVFQTFDTVKDYNITPWTERIAMTFENENGVLVGLM